MLNDKELDMAAGGGAITQLVDEIQNNPVLDYAADRVWDIFRALEYIYTR